MTRLAQESVGPGYYQCYRGTIPGWYQDGTGTAPGRHLDGRWKAAGGHLSSGMVVRYGNALAEIHRPAQAPPQQMERPRGSPSCSRLRPLLCSQSSISTSCPAFFHRRFPIPQPLPTNRKFEPTAFYFPFFYFFSLLSSLSHISPPIIIPSSLTFPLCCLYLLSFLALPPESTFLPTPCHFTILFFFQVLPPSA